MSSAERVPFLINPYSHDSREAGPGRSVLAAGRALAVGAIGLGAVAAVTGTAAADEQVPLGAGASGTVADEPDTDVEDVEVRGTGVPDVSELTREEYEQLLQQPADPLLAVEDGGSDGENATPESADGTGNTADPENSDGRVTDPPVPGDSVPFHPEGETGDGVVSSPLDAGKRPTPGWDPGPPSPAEELRYLEEYGTPYQFDPDEPTGPVEGAEVEILPVPDDDVELPFEDVPGDPTVQEFSQDPWTGDGVIVLESHGRILTAPEGTGGPMAPAYPQEPPPGDGWTWYGHGEDTATADGPDEEVEDPGDTEDELTAGFAGVDPLPPPDAYVPGPEPVAFVHEEPADPKPLVTPGDHEAPVEMPVDPGPVIELPEQDVDPDKPLVIAGNDEVPELPVLPVDPGTAVGPGDWLVID
ncbi:MAG TPA: hypothetical protein VD813_14955 [Pseudonocardia sp.]|nr:hypothetical protein [Pseudonocardia sp.]